MSGDGFLELLRETGAEAALRERRTAEGQRHLAALLEEVEHFTRRFVVMGNAEAIAVALWVAHTHAIEAAGSTPYLHVTSPTKRCGKSRPSSDTPTCARR